MSVGAWDILIGPTGQRLRSRQVVPNHRWKPVEFHLVNLVLPCYTVVPHHQVTNWLDRPQYNLWCVKLDVKPCYMCTIAVVAPCGLRGCKNRAHTVS